MTDTNSTPEDSPENPVGENTSKVENPTVTATDVDTKDSSDSIKVSKTELASLLTLLQEQDSSNKELIKTLSDKLDLTQQELAAFRKWAEENPEVEVTAGPVAEPVVSAPTTAGETTPQQPEPESTTAPVPNQKGGWKKFW